MILFSKMKYLNLKFPEALLIQIYLIFLKWNKQINLILNKNKVYKIQKKECLYMIFSITVTL